MLGISTYLKSFAGLFFPELCIVCNKYPKTRDTQFCLSCWYNLPLTHSIISGYPHFHDKFSNSVPLVNSWFLLHFREGNLAQKIIHEIKYNGRYDLAYTLGEVLGKQMNGHNISCIIPVPLHKNRLRKRGFNQSEHFAKGISSQLNIPVISNRLIRIKSTDSQTTKTRNERFINVENAFVINSRESSDLQGRNVLLVDDVVTTGATMQSCLDAFHDIWDIEFYLAAIAVAEN